MKLRNYFVIAVAPLSLLGCGPGGLTNQDTGTVVGAVAGGVIGNQFGSGKGKVLATAVGVVAGGIIGSEIGRRMDEHDRRQAMEAEYRALEYGNDDQPTRWRNANSGHYGSVTPGRRYRYEDYDCREYAHTVYIDGRPETMRGKACRQPDGTWKSVG